MMTNQPVASVCVNPKSMIRFNSDRKSGGAFFKGLPFSVGVNATLWNLAESRRFFDRWVCIHEKNKPFAEFCAERKLNAKGPNEQYTFDVFIALDALKDKSLATEGTSMHAYAYLPANSIEDAVRILQENIDYESI